MTSASCCPTSTKKNLEELKKKYSHDHEIAALKNALPGEGDPNAAGVAQSSDKMLSVQKNNENRSLKTNRLFPTPNKPDPMPQNLAFLFTKITPELWLNLSFPLCYDVFFLFLSGAAVVFQDMQVFYLSFYLLN